VKFILIAMAAFLTALPATAQTISLRPGETVTLRFDNGQAIVESAAAAEPIGEYDVYAVWRAESQDVPPGIKTVPPTFLGRGEGPPDMPRPVPDRIQLTMRDVPGPVPASPNHTVLIIANGYASKFGYRAAMHVSGRVSSTDVCELPPNMRGIEHWPYVIDELEISELRLDQPTTDVSCQ